MPLVSKLTLKTYKTNIGLAFLVGALIGYSSYEFLELQWSQGEGYSELNACFTPDQNCESLITETLNNAKYSILVQAYAFTSEPIAEALIKCHDKGIEVKVLYETKQESKNSQINKLKQSGIEVVPDKIKGIAHNKVIIVDSVYVITGSFNFTYAAQHMNAENVLLINNKKIVKYYTDNWYSRYAKAKTFIKIDKPVRYAVQ